MSIRSMTGFAQVRGEIQPQSGGSGPTSAATAPSNGRLAFALSLKSVNHRFLDLHFRLPSGTDSLEMQLRRLLKEKMGRGHVEISLSLERTSSEAFSLNREIVGAYIHAFRAAAAEFSLAAEPDLNAVLRMPGALDAVALPANGQVEAAVLARVEEVLNRLNQMREEEGRAIECELRQRMAHVRKAFEGVEQHRKAVLQTYVEKLRARMQELIS